MQMVTPRFVMPALIAFAVYHVPPSELHELAADDVLDDPEVDARQH